MEEIYNNNTTDNPVEFSGIKLKICCFNRTGPDRQRCDKNIGIHNLGNSLHFVLTHKHRTRKPQPIVS